MKIVYFGNNIRGVKCLSAVCEAGHQVAGVVVHRGAVGGSGPTSVYARAKELSIPTYGPEKVNAPDFIEQVRQIAPDLMILSGYTQILRKTLLSIPRLGTINLHGGRLPDYRGGSPINWQIINGETQGACSILYADEGIDTGDILATKTYAIGPDETAGEVTAKTLELFPPMLVDVLAQIASGTATATQQDRQAGCYYCQRRPQDGQIFWHRMTATQVHNLVRALNGPGLPGAFTYLAGKKYVICRTRLLNETICGPAGRIAIRTPDGVIVICRDRGILVQQVGLASGETVPAASCLAIRGHAFSSVVGHE